jgi:UDP-3-O-[3-hydroxymyristoyl] glucosamine N-acyltransferase
MDMTVGDIAQHVGGAVLGDPQIRISGVNSIQDALPGEITFVRASRYLPYLHTTRASAVLIAEPPEDCPPVTLILTPRPELAFAQLLPLCNLGQPPHPQGIHPAAVISPSAAMGQDVAVGACAHVAEECVVEDQVTLYSGVYVGKGARIGAGSVLYPNVVIREGTEIGARCIIHAGACIGSDGFGFAPIGGRWVKIPQVGRVVIGDDVEIGTNTAIDRATFGVTRVGRGTKIDNLVQIGHNVVIGEDCVLAGMVGIAGSAVIGNGVRIGAGAGINGHIDIGDGATVGAWAGVVKPVAPGQVVSGFPAMDHALERRILVAQQRSPELIRRVRQLEREVEELKKKLHE